MLPRFHAGDLAVVRRESSYHVGEIVAYRSRMLHTIVLHRIVGRDGSRYVFKGDNNNFLDLEHPTQSQLVGKLWFHVPGLGRKLGFLRSPFSTGGLVALAFLLFGGAAFTEGRRRRRARRRPSVPWAVPAGIVLAAVCAVPFVRPASRTVPVAVPYRQSGTFGYSAHTTPGDVYASGQVSAGAPVFLRLVHGLDVSFAYRFTSTESHRVHATASLAAKLVSSAGWQRTFVLAPPTTFKTGTFTLHGELDLQAISALIQRFELTTHASGTYTLALVPHVAVAGSVGAAALNTHYGSPFTFTLDSVELRPGVEPAAKLASATNGALHVSGRRAVSLSLLGLGVHVGTARIFAAVVLAGLLAVLAGFGAGFGGLEFLAEDATRVHGRHRRKLVAVDAVDLRSAQQVVDVTDLDALATIADRYERMILVAGDDDGTTYSVAEDGVLYRFRTAA